MNKTKQTISKTLINLIFFLLLCNTEIKAYASDEQEYITISVDATDENGNLLYALDTDDPSAFTSHNEFSVPAGTHHTIYVKDAAGNISSQEFYPSEEYTYGQNVETDGRTVNIDVTLNEPSHSLENESTASANPAEPGQGTLYEKVTTDAADQNAERLFYTITTKEDEVFYMMIDQGQSSNNVYLLDQVNLSDLKFLAVNDSNGTQTESSSSLLGALNSSEGNSGNDPLIDNTESSAVSDKGSRMKSNLIILLIIAVVGGGYYYYKNIYKNKKDEQMDIIDALDREDFVADDGNDAYEEDVNFEMEENYQEQIIQQLLEEDNENNKEKTGSEGFTDGYIANNGSDFVKDDDDFGEEDDDDFGEEDENEEDVK